MVPAAAIDGNGHVNNVEYVRWMQEIAKSHADACGGATVVESLGAAWVVRSHHIEYLKPLREGDGVTIRTWVDRFDRVTSIRRYELIMAATGALVARGETKWVLIDVQSGRPRAITRELAACFGVGPDETPAD
ncbi:hypothetical protein AYO41_01335 [Verrucomicrobia bacterium SCGC AG-212-E04]|nr:hypothetical protein AYO41_01335 [Verrucomicrobia bacterium SCGC AG-212-E04]